MIHVVAASKAKPEHRAGFFAGANLCDKTRDDLSAHSRWPHLNAWRELSASMKVSPIQIISGGETQRL